MVAKGRWHVNEPDDDAAQWDARPAKPEARQELSSGRHEDDAQILRQWYNYRMYNPQLETFIRAADAGSVRKAAQEAFITPTAVSKQISLLEESLGVRLFDRSHSGLTLTPAGESLYHDAKYIIAYCREARKRAEAADKQGTHVLRIGTSMLTPACFLTSLCEEAELQMPDIRVQIVAFQNHPDEAQEILSNLGQSIDVVGGVCDEHLLELRQCAGTPLMSQPLTVGVPIDHPLAEKEILEPSDLAGQTILLIARGWSRSMDKLRDELNAERPDVRIVDFPFFDLEIFNRCASGEGLLVGIPFWDGVHPQVRMMPVGWKHSIPFGVLHAPSPTAFVQRFLSVVRAMHA